MFDRNVFLLALLAIACGDVPPDLESTTSSQQSIENGDVHPLADAAIMKNVAFEKGEGLLLGSGALLRNNWVLTAAHLFPADRLANPSTTSKVRYGNELLTPARIFIAPGLDVALVSLSTGALIDGSRTGFVRSLYSGTAASTVGQTLDCWGFGANNADGTGVGILRQAFQGVVASTTTSIAIQRNARGQLMSSGDSGGVCFLGGAAVSVHHGRNTPVNGVYQRGEETHAAGFKAWAESTIGWRGCRGSGNSVCSSAANASYFTHFPNCSRNTTCGGQLYSCWAECPPPSPSEMSNAVTWGKSFSLGESLVSPNGQFTMIWQTDSNLVVYRNSDGRALWNSRTHGSGANQLIYQGDGNLVMYKPVAIRCVDALGRACTAGKPGCLCSGPTQAVWSTGTHGSPAGSYLAMQDDNNLVIRSPAGAVQWSYR